MAIILSAAYKAQLTAGINKPVTIIEVELDSGIVKWGTSEARFNDVFAILQPITSLQNKINIEKGFASLGSITVTIIGRENFEHLLRDEYLKNRRVTRKDGFDAPDYLYSEYAPTFTGKIADWSRTRDKLTLTIDDERTVDMKIKLPVENATKTQFIDYRATNIVDVMLDILIVRLGISASRVDVAQFESERDTWLPAWIVDRVLTTPVGAGKLLAELCRECNGFVIHDGEKISFKYFGPPAPGENVEEWTDDDVLLAETITVSSGYKDKHFNRIIIASDYDEDGNEKYESYSSVDIESDVDSQGSPQWNQVISKTIKSKWIRSLTYTQPSNITGTTLYHSSTSNGIGSGTLTYNYSANTLTWTPPGGITGVAVTLNKDGKYQIFGEDTTKYIRVIVELASLPVSNQIDTIVITSLSGATLASSLGNKLLQRHRDPVPTVTFEVDINDVSMEGTFIKPTDPVNLTTAEVAYKGVSFLDRERFMIISTRPNFNTGRVEVEAVKGGLPADASLRYGFIAPAGQPDYATATESERGFAYIGRGSDNKVFDGVNYVEGFHIYY